MSGMPKLQRRRVAVGYCPYGGLVFIPVTSNRLCCQAPITQEPLVAVPTIEKINFKRNPPGLMSIYAQSVFC